MTRRRFVELGAAALALGPLGCNSNPQGPQVTEGYQAGRLTVRPHEPTEELEPGTHPLNLHSPRDGYIYLPSGYQHGTPLPALIAFHGAGRAASEWDGAKTIADQVGLILIVPDSRGITWDIVRDGFGPDVAFTDAALERAFTRCSIDPTRFGACGFSDGATYSLSLGLTNGDLFTHLIAFSPGFVIHGELRGKPKIHVTHGTQDGILPIDSTSRIIVPSLREAGYDVTYIEFEGGHQISAQLGGQVFRWFTEGAASG